MRSAAHLSYRSLKGQHASRRLLLRSRNKSSTNGAAEALALYLGDENDAKVSQILLKAPLVSAVAAAAAQRKPSVVLKEVNGSTTSPGWMFFFFFSIKCLRESTGRASSPEVAERVKNNHCRYQKKATDVFSNLIL